MLIYYALSGLMERGDVIFIELMPYVDILCPFRADVGGGLCYLTG